MKKTISVLSSMLLVGMVSVAIAEIPPKSLSMEEIIFGTKTEVSPTLRTVKDFGTSNPVLIEPMETMEQVIFGSQIQYSGEVSSLQESYQGLETPSDDSSRNLKFK